MAMYEWMSKLFMATCIYGVVDGFMLSIWACGWMRL